MTRSVVSRIRGEPEELGQPPVLQRRKAH
jgi:hypothetical protein